MLPASLSGSRKGSAGGGVLCTVKRKLCNNYELKCKKLTINIQKISKLCKVNINIMPFHK